MRKTNKDSVLIWKAFLKKVELEWQEKGYSQFGSSYDEAFEQNSREQLCTKIAKNILSDIEKISPDGDQIIVKEENLAHKLDSCFRNKPHFVNFDNRYLKLFKLYVGDRKNNSNTKSSYPRENTKLEIQPDTSLLTNKHFLAKEDQIKMIIEHEFSKHIDKDLTIEVESMALLNRYIQPSLRDFLKKSKGHVNATILFHDCSTTEIANFKRFYERVIDPDMKSKMDRTSRQPYWRLRKKYKSKMHVKICIFKHVLFNYCRIEDTIITIPYLIGNQNNMPMFVINRETDKYAFESLKYFFHKSTNRSCPYYEELSPNDIIPEKMF